MKANEILKALGREKASAKVKAHAKQLAVIIDNYALLMPVMLNQYA